MDLAHLGGGFVHRGVVLLPCEELGDGAGQDLVQDFKLHLLCFRFIF